MFAGKIGNGSTNMRGDNKNQGVLWIRNYKKKKIGAITEQESLCKHL